MLGHQKQKNSAQWSSQVCTCGLYTRAQSKGFQTCGRDQGVEGEVLHTVGGQQAPDAVRSQALERKGAHDRRRFMGPDENND